MSVYLVHMEIDCYVVAEDEFEAKMIATSEAEVDPKVSFVHEVKSLKDVSKELHDSIPWGTEDDRTLKEILRGS